MKVNGIFPDDRQQYAAKALKAGGLRQSRAFAAIRSTGKSGKL